MLFEFKKSQNRAILNITLSYLFSPIMSVAGDNISRFLYKFISSENTLIFFLEKSVPLKRKYLEGKIMKLSQREKEIMELMSLGYEDKEISNRLKISPRTIQTYINRCILKLDGRNRIGTVANYIKEYYL